jgi:hypothetical protein
LEEVGIRIRVNLKNERETGRTALPEATSPTFSVSLRRRYSRACELEFIVRTGGLTVFARQQFEIKTDHRDANKKGSHTGEPLSLRNRLALSRLAFSVRSWIGGWCSFRLLYGRWSWCGLFAGWGCFRTGSSLCCFAVFFKGEGCNSLFHFLAHLELNHSSGRHGYFFKRSWIMAYACGPDADVEDSKVPKLDSVALRKLVYDLVENGLDYIFYLQRVKASLI